MFTIARYRSLSWASWIQFTTSDPISLRSSHLRLGLPTGFFLQFSDQNFMLISHLSHACYMLRPSPPGFDHPNNIWWSVQVMKLLIMQSSPASRHFLPLRSKYSLSTLFLNILNPVCPSLSVRDQVSHPYETGVTFLNSRSGTPVSTLFTPLQVLWNRIQRSLMIRIQTCSCRNQDLMVKQPWLTLKVSNCGETSDSEYEHEAL
jgi:hypothetical protein